MLHRFAGVMERLKSMRMPRTLRRWHVVVCLLVVLVNYATAIMALHPWSGSSRLSGFAAFCSALTGAVYVAFWARWLRRTSSGMNAAMSLEDRAALDFAKPFASLSPMHQFDVKVRVSREMRNRHSDERDAVLQREAERVALRVLRVVVPVLVLAYWAWCLFAPVGPLRVGLLVGAVVMTAVMIPVLVLRDLIRLWTEPDAAREPKVVGIGGSTEADPLRG